MRDRNTFLSRKYSDRSTISGFPTEDSQPVVDGDDHDVAVAGEDGAVVEVAAAPDEAVAVNEEDDWEGRVVKFTWKVF